jgi:hypothetical protein
MRPIFELRQAEDPATGTVADACVNRGAERDQMRRGQNLADQAHADGLEILDRAALPDINKLGLLHACLQCRWLAKDRIIKAKWRL